jgi:hypothetical protein
MTREQWERLKAVFLGALDQPTSDRKAWLAQACAGDTALLREVEALLRVHEGDEEFLAEPARLDSPDLETLTAGTRLGPYLVLEEIARGGMGIVYLAEDSRLGRRVALKALPAVVSANPDMRARLRREARAAATISHPGVATVYALEEFDDHLFIVSEYVSGETMRSVVARGPIDPERTRILAAQVARALSAAHDAGVVHRDLKPENVLLTPAGDVKVVDFGIAHVEGPETLRLTRTGAMLGTPAYMAPEQLLGTVVDARSDVYSFGVLLSEMLTGRHPLADRNRATPTPTPTPGAATVRLAAIAARCMQPDPASRYANARELIAVLESDTVIRDSELATAAAGSARWWWEFHQAMTALVYFLMAIPAWQAREGLGTTWGRGYFVATLVAIIVAATLRLHLWFTSRFYPGELRWVRRRVKPWIRAADWLFVAALTVGGVMVDSAPLAVLMVSVAVGAALTFLIIERGTTRAAFRLR